MNCTANQPHLRHSHAKDPTLPPAAFSEAVDAEKAFLESTLDRSHVRTTVFDVPVEMGTMHTLKAEPTGDGPRHAVPIVLVHGFTGALGFWRHLIPRLTAEGHTVYAVDLLGWGLSSRPRAFPNWEWTQAFDRRRPRKTVDDVAAFWVDSLAQWRDHISSSGSSSSGSSSGSSSSGSSGTSLGRVHLVGHSLGGWVCGEFALAFPQHTARLTLLNSVGVYVGDRSWFNGSAGRIMEATRAALGVNWPFALLRLIDAATLHRLRLPAEVTEGLTDGTARDMTALYRYVRAYNALPSSGETAAEYIRRPGRAHARARSNSSSSSSGGGCSRRDNNEDPTTLAADPYRTLWDRLPHIAAFPVSLAYGEADETVPGYDPHVLDQLSSAPGVDVAVVSMGAGHGMATSAEPAVAGAVAAVVLGAGAVRAFDEAHPGQLKLRVHRTRADLEEGGEQIQPRQLQSLL